MNTNYKSIRDKLEGYNGTIYDAISRMDKEGYTPITVKDVLENRLSSIGTSDEQFWHDQEFLTADFITGRSDGRIKYFPYSKNKNFLLNSERGESDTLSEEEYSSLIGPEYSYNDLKKSGLKNIDFPRGMSYFTGSFKKSKEVCRVPILLDLAGGYSILKQIVDLNVQNMKKQKDHSFVTEIYLFVGTESIDFLKISSVEYQSYIKEIHGIGGKMGGSHHGTIYGIKKE